MHSTHVDHTLQQLSKFQITTNAIEMFLLQFNSPRIKWIDLLNCVSNRRMHIVCPSQYHRPSPSTTCIGHQLRCKQESLALASLCNGEWNGICPSRSRVTSLQIYLFSIISFIQDVGTWGCQYLVTLNVFQLLIKRHRDSPNGHECRRACVCIISSVIRSVKLLRLIQPKLARCALVNPIVGQYSFEFVHCVCSARK